MKRFLALLVALVLFVPCAYADDGVFVPSYSAFMEAFTRKVKSINETLYQDILEDCFVDGKWVDPSGHSTNQVYCFSVPIGMRIYEGNDFLRTLYITLPKDKLETDETMFKDIILAAGTSIIPTADTDFEQTFFENLYYDYALSSPAGYIVMYWNCGVYLFQITKMSNEIEFQISLSVYEAE